MATALNQPLKIHGGKNYLAKKIVALMPRHLNYVEPYAGGLAVLLARDTDDESLWLPPHKGVSEVVNDINSNLTNFWQVLKHWTTFEAFYRIMEVTPFSEVEYRTAITLLRHTNESDILKACYFFVACRQSLAGRMKGFTGITKTRTRARMNNEVSAWLTAVEGLPTVHERLKRVLVLNREALDVIQQFDTPESLQYLDPPYLSETRKSPDVYAHEMTKEQHTDLLDTIQQCKCKIMLSGYPSEMYNTALKNWNQHTFDIANHSAGGKKKERKQETLWCNF